MTNASMIFFGDIAAFNFTQLADGRWVGQTAAALWVSVDSFAQGESPDSFKHTQCVRL